jgi:lysyl-tRNA synthetase, class I
LSTPQGQSHHHWAQQMALEIKDRIEKDEQLSKLVAEHGLLVYDEKTPSGTIHIGSGRGWVIHDVVAKCLRDLGIKAQFILSSDDYDPYDKPNKELDPEKFNPYLGRPFCDIPSPVEGYTSFGDYYFKQSTQHFSKLGIECGFESTADNYKNGVFNAQIKTILDNTDKVQQVYLELYGENSPAASKVPFNVKCTSCGKIATTLASKWDKEKEEIYFECRDDVVEWAKGCGHQGWTSPYNGGGKFPWKVEWAAKWPARGVVVEFGGKDHFSKGGSRTCANKIAVDIFNFPPPYPSFGYKTGPGYEFFQIGGAKMSTSKGKGMSFVDGVTFFPGEMLRFLLLKSRPNSVVDFDPEKNDILLLCDQFDRMERIHFGIDPAKDESDKAVHSALYRLVSMGPPRDFFAPQIPLNLASTLLQITLSKEAAFEKLIEMGHLTEEVTEQQKQVIFARFDLAQRWVDNFASEQFLFRLVDENSGATDLSAEDIAILAKFTEFLSSLPKDLKDSKVLHSAFYDFAKSNDMEAKDVFPSIYRGLIQKERGPQLANFIVTIGIEKTIRLLQAGLNK